MFLDFCLKLNWLDEIAPWIYCSLKQLFLTHTPACGHFRNKPQFPWIFRYSIAWLAALSALIRFCKTEALPICGTAKHCIFGGVWEKHRCFFCSPGDKETKPCAEEAESVPAGYIEALRVRLLSQPLLSSSERELHLLLCCLETFCQAESKGTAVPFRGCSHSPFLLALLTWAAMWPRCRRRCFLLGFVWLSRWAYLCQWGLKFVCLKEKHIAITAFSKCAK